MNDATAATSVGSAYDPSAPAGLKPLRTRVLRASALVLAEKPIGMAIGLVRNLILTRLLFPEAFGLMALVSVVLNGMTMCSDLGAGVNIVRHPRGTEPRFFCTLWTIGIVRGVILWIACSLLAWPLARFYGQPVLSSMLPVCGLNFVLWSLSSMNPATLRRELLLGRVMVFDYGQVIVSTVLLAVLAFLLRSVWALVIGTVCVSGLRAVFSHVFLPGVKHRLCWDRDAARDIVHFGRWVFVSSLLTFFAAQMDRLMLGKLVSIELLGIYSIALSLAALPRDTVGQLIVAVLFPVLSQKARSDPDGLRQAFSAARAGLLRIALLATVGTAVAAPVFFRLYDPRYWAAAELARVLMAVVWFECLCETTGVCLLSLGDSGGQALYNAVRVATTLPACLMGFRLLGIQGFIVGAAVGTLAGEVTAAIRLRRRGVSLLWQDTAFTISGALLAGIGVGGDLLLAHYAPANVAVLARLAFAGILLLILGAFVAWSLWAMLLRGRAEPAAGVS